MARANRIYYGAENPSYRPALERFAEKCRFDPLTGCVLWIGGTTAGHGNSARYGSFWFEGARWFAHRWSAIHIKGLSLGENQAGHCCPCGPNTLCVEHVTGQTQLDNLVELNTRLGQRRKAAQALYEKQYWLLVHRGYEDAPTNGGNPELLIDAPEPPEWFRPYLKIEESDDGECPF